MSYDEEFIQLKALESDYEQIITLCKQQTNQLKKAETLLNFIEHLVTDQKCIPITRQTRLINQMIQERIGKYRASSDTQEDF